MCRVLRQQASANLKHFFRILSSVFLNHVSLYDLRRPPACYVSITAASGASHRERRCLQFPNLRFEHLGETGGASAKDMTSVFRTCPAHHQPSSPVELEHGRDEQHGERTECEGLSAKQRVFYPEKTEHATCTHTKAHNNVRLLRLQTCFLVCVQNAVKCVTLQLQKRHDNQHDGQQQEAEVIVVIVAK